MTQMMRLGDILIKRQLISKTQLEQFLNQYPYPPKRLGELLVEHHLISSQDQQDALREQYWRQKGHWVID